MGWSCRREAAQVVERWCEGCRAQNGSSNTFRYAGVEYFFEISQKEHPDGAITGKILRLASNGYAYPAGSFRVEGDGRVTRAPKFLRRLGGSI